MKEEYFIFAGRIDKQKGVDVLLEAWKLMGDEAPKLLICGTGPMEDWCKEYVKENSLTLVEMKGFVPNIEVKKLIANSGALILPTQWYEGFPMTIVEAYSVGTPVIGPDMGNVGSLIEEGVNGWKFVCSDSRSLADAIRKANNVKTEDMPGAYRTYKDKYSKEVNYRILNEIYSSITVQ